HRPGRARPRHHPGPRDRRPRRRREPPVNLPPVHPTPVEPVPGWLAAQPDRLGPVVAVSNPIGAPTAYALTAAAVGELFTADRAGTLALHNTAAVRRLFRRAVFTLRGRKHEDTR